LTKINNTGNAINFGKVSNFGKVRTAKAMCWGLLGGFGRKRKRAEEGREGFWWKKALRRVGLAY